jgi:hypothetical protein
MPLRRKVIHDSSPSSSPPRGSGQLVTEPTAKLVCRAAEQPGSAVSACFLTKRNFPDAEGFAVTVISDGDESSSEADSHAEPSLLTPLQFAGRFGRFPSKEDSKMIAAVTEPVLNNDADGNLWNAVPPRTCQYLDLEAVCVDDTSSGSSESSDGQMSPGFVDDVEDSKEIVTPDDIAFMERHFPHTLR